jgi:hypothetical protein
MAIDAEHVDFSTISALDHDLTIIFSQQGGKPLLD